MIDNIKLFDYCALVDYISACANRDIKPNTFDSVLKLLEGLEWCDAIGAVKTLCSQSPIPANILGALSSAVSANQRSAQAREWKDTKTTDDLGLTGKTHPGTCSSCGAPATVEIGDPRADGCHWFHYTCEFCKHRYAGWYNYRDWIKSKKPTKSNAAPYWYNN